MLKHHLLRITVTTALTAISSLAIAPAVFAITPFLVRGTFQDGGQLYGSFEYSNGNYTDVNITSTTANSQQQAIYTDESSISGASSTGFAMYSDDDNFLLNIVLSQNLNEASPSSVISLNSNNSYEDNFFSANRRTIEGTVTAVPFEFTPSLGLLLLLTIFGTQQGLKYWRINFSLLSKFVKKF